MPCSFHACSEMQENSELSYFTQYTQIIIYNFHMTSCRQNCLRLSEDWGQGTLHDVYHKEDEFHSAPNPGHTCISCLQVVSFRPTPRNDQTCHSNFLNSERNPMVLPSKLNFLEERLKITFQFFGFYKKEFDFFWRFFSCQLLIRSERVNESAVI